MFNVTILQVLWLQICRKQDTVVQVPIFWVATPCIDVVGYHLHPEDGGSTVLRNAGISLHGVTTPEDLELIFTTMKTSKLPRHNKNDLHFSDTIIFSSEQCTGRITINTLHSVVLSQAQGQLQLHLTINWSLGRAICIKVTDTCWRTDVDNQDILVYSTDRQIARVTYQNDHHHSAVTSMTGKR
jgi:hypothetical protein